MGGLLDALIAGQPEVVVGPEHDPRGALHLDDGEGRPLEHAEVGEGVERARRLQLLQPFMLTHLREDIGRRHHQDRNGRGTL